MNLFLKIAISIVLLALFASALLSVLASLLSRVTTDTSPRLTDPDDGEPDYHGIESFGDGRDRDRAVIS
jgi:hypothetical protein